MLDGDNMAGGKVVVVVDMINFVYDRGLYVFWV